MTCLVSITRFWIFFFFLSKVKTKLKYQIARKWHVAKEPN